MEEHFDKEAKEGWRFAANAGRITHGTTGSEDRKHTSGGLFVAVDSNLGAVVGAKEGAIESIPGNEGRIAQAWVNVRGGLRVFSVYFWHSEGWTLRNEALLEAVLKQTGTTRHPWLIACDANMCPEDFEKSLWFQRELMHVVAPKEASTCRSKGPKDVWPKRCVARKNPSQCRCEWSSQKEQISQTQVVEDFESRPHEAVSFVVRREKEIKEWNEQKLPKVLPGYSGVKLPGRSTKEKRQRRRRGRRGRRRKKDQGSNGSRSGCRHQREGRRA